MFDDIGKSKFNYHDDVFRNRKTVKPTQDLFDDLSDNPKNWEVAITLDKLTRPNYSAPSIIHAPFAYFTNSLDKNDPWPSRFSDGSFPAWYGSVEQETTVFETLYHFIYDYYSSGLREIREPVIVDREIFKIEMKAEICDLRKMTKYDLNNPVEWAECQQIGKWMFDKNYSGAITGSARCDGNNIVCFKENVLLSHRNYRFVTYRFYPSKNIAVVSYSDSEYRVRVSNDNYISLNKID